MYTKRLLRDLSCGSGLLPSRRRSLAPAVSLTPLAAGLRSLLERGNQRLAPCPCSALPPAALCRGGCTSIHFGENQLSPRSVGISPLSTAPPPVLQHWWVRASTTFHRRFTLLMGSSHGFGSDRCYVRALHTRLPSGSPPIPGRLTGNNDLLAGSFYKRHAISPWCRIDTVTSDCW